MLKEEQIRVLRELQHGIDNGVSADAGGIVRAPVTDYTCPELLAKEQQVFFKETPLLLGLAADLPEPNTYYATAETGVPILMTRDGDGQFHAFLNVCRHRGVQVVPDGRGKKNRFTCPFHAWSYRNTGDLIAVNREQKFGCIDKSSHGLVALPAHEKHGMLWVRPSPGDDFDVDTLLGGIAGDLASWNMSGYEYDDAQVIRADINWKLAIDTFGENYHFDVLHKNSLASEIYGNLQTHDIFGQHYRMVFATKWGWRYVAEQKLPIEQWPYEHITLNVYFIFPNVILLPDANRMHLLRMYPDQNNPGKSRTHHNTYLSQYALEQIARHVSANGEIEPTPDAFEGFNNVVVNEDYAAAAST
ncbi:MAG: aromatic ring-hydroxylating dioxygenase subunit alpha [Proteobacteria bacterium]|nr:aromatic ring-hydroxylating dioxygenase subunit alpha [Pseudomonadota bacterium]